MSDATRPKFNDDLLLSEEDRQLARQSFPHLAFALDFSELRDLFSEFDGPTNLAKRKRRRAGIVAILCGLLALLGASSEPLYANLSPNLLTAIGGLLAILGIASVLIGAVGVLNDSAKQDWLCGRLMTERIRQFHFQTLVFRAPRVLAGMHDAEQAELYLKSRAQWFATFRASYAGKLVAQLNDVLADDVEERFGLHDDREEVVVTDADSLTEFFSAYRLLRLEHQIQYANYKLRDDTFESARRQAAALRDIALISILLVFALHAVIAVSMIRPLGSWLHFAQAPWLHVVILWTAIAALAARALEEGLQPAREIERYRRYRAVLLRCRHRFDDARDPSERFEVMRETERTVYQEMVGFLKTNHEARFVL